MTNVRIAHFVDQLGLVLWLLLPVIVVLRIRGWRGIILGGLTFWLVGIAIGYLLSELDPQREGGLIDALFLITGFPAGLIYACAILLIGEGFQFLRQRLQQPRPLE